MTSMQRRWKGKIVTERQYARRLKQQEAGRNRRKKCTIEDVVMNTNDSTLEDRLELRTLRTKLICKFCKEALSLMNAEKEHKNGLASVLSIRCQKCLFLNEVLAGECQKNSTERKDIYATNIKALTDTSHCGMGYCQTKSLSTLNISMIAPQTYENYETKEGPIIEVVAEKSVKNLLKESIN